MTCGQAVSFFHFEIKEKKQLDNHKTKQIPRQVRDKKRATAATHYAQTCDKLIEVDHPADRAGANYN